MDRVKTFVSQNFNTDPEKFGYWEAFGSLLLTPFEVQQRKYAYPKPKPVDNTEAEPTAANETPAATETPTVEANMAKKANHSKPAGGKPDFSFTAGEDATLKEMKDRGDEIKNIAKALKKPKEVVKKRYDEIATPAQKAAAANNAGEKKGEQAKKSQQATKTNASKSKGNKASEAKTCREPVSPAPQINMPQCINGLQNITVFPDEIFSAIDLVWFCNAFMYDNEERWIRLASRFYDITGRRIHPHTIKQKLMQSGLST